MRKNKLLTIFVASAIILSSLTGMVSCGKSDESESVGGSSEGTSTSIPSPVSTVDDVESHKVEGTLHDVNVNYENSV